MSTLREKTEEFQKLKEAAKKMGGADKVARQHERGKLDARARIEKLLDEGSFSEFGALATFHLGGNEVEGVAAAADGVVTGYGTIDGRPVAIASYDFTVLGGSIGQVGETKVTRLREQALTQRIPIIWLIDSAGARIHKKAGLGNAAMITMFANSGFLFREQVIMSGVIPQVAAMVGPGAAGTAYIPGLADFVPMVKGTSSMALGGPPLVKAAVGEDISEEELGGAKIHNDISGCADLMVKNDEACLESIRQYLSYFPSHNGELPPINKEAPDGNALLDEAVLDFLPENSRSSYDMRKLIPMIVDHGTLFEIKPRFAKNLITGLARIGGYSVGIVANNPRYLGGVLDVDSADKAARFVMLCDAYNIPLVFLTDVPGFMVGSKVEQQGIIRHGAKMLYAVSEATVPKLNVIVRKAYGAGYYVMCGRAYEPDLIVAWPNAEISVMGAEGMVGIAAKKELELAPNPDEVRAMMADMIRPFIDIRRVAAQAFIDDVIDPRATRQVLFRALQRTRNKVVERPHKKHGVLPV